MIYELRTYTVKPGGVGEMVKAASTVSKDIRGNNFGKLEGYWSTEIGPLNQVLHMWSYSDLNERAKLRAELAKNARWASEYLPLIRKDPKHRWMLRVWLVIYVFVGIQMGWVLRPFIGNPDAPVQFFREHSWSNAYEVVIQMIWEVLFGRGRS